MIVARFLLHKPRHCAISLALVVTLNLCTCKANRNASSSLILRSELHYGFCSPTPPVISSCSISDEEQNLPLMIHHPPWISEAHVSFLFYFGKKVFVLVYQSVVDFRIVHRDFPNLEFILMCLKLQLSNHGHQASLVDNPFSFESTGTYLVRYP